MHRSKIILRGIFSLGILVIFFPRMPAWAGPLVNVLTIPGETTDFFTDDSGANHNRLGGFGSDLYYNRRQDLFYAVPDRGPGGGLLPYQQRVQIFSLNVQTDTGEISNFQLQNTWMLSNSEGTENFNGLSPGLLGGDVSTLGMSLDPEAVVVSSAGMIYIADEYGPALYEFSPPAGGSENQVRRIREFEIPDRLLPIDSDGEINYVAGRSTSPALISGRQGNRGFEGLAISPDGKTLFAALQDPLAEEGNRSQGRRGPHVRILQYDVATGQSTGQFLYALEDYITINTRIPGTFNDFEEKDQGRDIGISAITALNDHQLLVLERDTRGITPDNPLGAVPEDSAVGTKRIYKIDLSGATDVSDVSLSGSSLLPPGIDLVSKTLLVDLQAELLDNGQLLPERIEGLTVGPMLDDGRFAVILSTDNDFSVSQNDDGTQFDVFTDGSMILVDGDPLGRSLLPTYLYSVAVDLPDYVAPVPEPSSWILMVVGIMTLFGLARRNSDLE